MGYWSSPHIARSEGPPLKGPASIHNNITHNNISSGALCPISYRHSPYGLVFIQDKSPCYTLKSIDNGTLNCRSLLAIPNLSDFSFTINYCVFITCIICLAYTLYCFMTTCTKLAAMYYTTSTRLTGTFQHASKSDLQIQ